MVNFRTLVKAIVSLGLLSYLIYLADPAKVWQAISNIWTMGGTMYVLVSVLIFIFATYVFAWRWKILLKGYDLDIPIPALFRFYLIGLFFNNFLPTGIGGDVTRIYNLIQESGDRTIGFASVLVERILGIAGTLLLSLFSLIWLLRTFSSNNILYITLGLLAIILVFFQIVFNRKLSEPIRNKTGKISFFRIGERVNKFLDAIRIFENKKQIFLYVILLSVLGQTLVIFMTWFLVLALGLNTSLGYMFLVVPVTFLLTMLPSINGFGVRDGGFILLLAREGISKAGAISLSFMAIIVPMIVSVWGALLFVTQKTKMEDLNDVEQII